AWSCMKSRRSLTCRLAPRSDISGLGGSGGAPPPDPFVPELGGSGGVAPPPVLPTASIMASAGLAAAGVHLEMGPGPQLGDLDEWLPVLHGQALLGPTVAPALPGGAYERGDLLLRRPVPERSPQVDARGGIEAQQPLPVG